MDHMIDRMEKHVLSGIERFRTMAETIGDDNPMGLVMAHSAYLSMIERMRMYYAISDSTSEEIEKAYSDAQYDYAETILKLSSKFY